MKCPTCNAWSNVLETRQIKSGLKRRRECANLHRFVTYETEINHEEVAMFNSRRVFDWMRNILQQRKRQVSQSKGSKSQTRDEVLGTDKVLDNIMQSIARSNNEKR